MGGAVSAGVNNDDLIDNLVNGKYIKSPQVEKAFRAIDRAHYYADGLKGTAYKDLAWKHGNLHMSAPCIYSEVMESLHLEPGMSFLNLGSGTGYLSTMIGLLLGPFGVNHGIELHEDVVEYANKKLQEFKESSNALDEYELCEPQFVVGNCFLLDVDPGRLYDRVYCGAACPVDRQEYVKRFLKTGGILVMPIEEQLMRITKLSDNTYESIAILPVSFASLVLPISDLNVPEVPFPDSQPLELQAVCRANIRVLLRKKVDSEYPHLKGVKRSGNSYSPMKRSKICEKVIPNLGGNGRGSNLRSRAASAASTEPGAALPEAAVGEPESSNNGQADVAGPSNVEETNGDLRGMEHALGMACIRRMFGSAIRQNLNERRAHKGRIDYEWTSTDNTQGQSMSYIYSVTGDEPDSSSSCSGNDSDSDNTGPDEDKMDEDDLPVEEEVEKDEVNIKDEVNMDDEKDEDEDGEDEDGEDEDGEDEDGEDEDGEDEDGEDEDGEDEDGADGDGEVEEGGEDDGDQNKDVTSDVPKIENGDDDDAKDEKVVPDDANKMSNGAASGVATQLRRPRIQRVIPVDPQNGEPIDDPFHLAFSVCSNVAPTMPDFFDGQIRDRFYSIRRSGVRPNAQATSAETTSVNGRKAKDDDEDSYAVLMRRKVLALPLPVKLKAFLNYNRNFDA